jgi:hypothetical protein
MNRLPLVKLLTRPGCVTCDQAKFILKKIKGRGLMFEGKVINILKDRQYIKFNDELPVILVDEEVASRTYIVESDLYKAIEDAANKQL